MWKDHRIYGGLMAAGKPVVVVGAGTGGAMLVRELERSPDWRVVALVDEAEWASRAPAIAPPPALGVGRELFALFRIHADEAEKGGSAVLAAMETVI